MSKKTADVVEVTEAPESAEVTVREVTFKGVTFFVALDIFDDLEVLEAWEDGKHVALTRAILGKEQWAVFKSTKRPVEDLYLLLTELIKADA